MPQEYNYQAKKIVAVLAEKLEMGVALNVIGHLAVSIGAYADKDIMGQEIIPDASGNKHIGISRYPFIITKANKSKIRQAISEARNNPQIFFVDYPSEMLSTGHDDELVQAIGEKEEVDIEYLGAVFYGTTEEVKKITGKFSLWK
ncbi:MAG: DUF2000 domain-containing protein [Candidatus Moraniibacteriota bacterium]|jgi:hypothetical protein